MLIFVVWRVFQLKLKGSWKMKKEEKVKPYQVILNEQVHQNLKKTAKKLDMTKGDFIQNLYASLEYRLTKYRNKIGFSESARSDELDVRLMKFIIFKDKGSLSPVEIEMKLEKIKRDYEYLSNRPEITVEDEDV
jgi:hypothetical protein